MAKKRSRFSFKEDRQLIQMAATSVTLEEAAAIFRTSVNTIENKCKRLGIQLRRRGRKRSTQEWTEAEVHQLRMLAKRKVRADSIAKLLGRYVGSVRTKALNLRLILSKKVKAKGKWAGNLGRASKMTVWGRWQPLVEAPEASLFTFIAHCRLWRAEPSS
jgi:hypothetical protein